MTQPLPGGLRGLSYANARRLLIVGGLVVLLLTAAVMYARRVDTVEVAAVLLFIPVFLGFMLWNLTGGLVAAVLAFIAYLVLRLPAIDAVGLSHFQGHLVSRALAYLAFGGIGGWAVRELESSLTKLDLYDQIDDDTGLYNARFLVQDTELEMARCARYQTLFSVVVVDVPAPAVDSLGRRQRQSLLRHLGRRLRDSVRTVDRVVHAHDERSHRIAVVLPETASEGARVFADRLVQWVTETLAERGASDARQGVTRLVLTYPDDEAGLTRLRDEFAAIDRAEHPETADTS